MKKLFTSLVFISLALLTTECKVSNVEPVPEVVESSDGSKMTIFGTPKLKGNVKILSEHSANEIVINGDKIIIPVNVTLFLSGNNGRASAEEAKIKVGDILVKGPKPKDEKDAIPIQLDAELRTIKIGAETVSIEFSFHLLTNATDIFTDFSGIFEASFNISLNKNLNLTGEKEWKSREDDDTKQSYAYNVKSTLPFPLQFAGSVTMTVTAAIEIVNSTFKKAGIILRTNIQGGPKFDLKGSLIATSILQTILKSRPYQHSRIFVLPNGMPIVLGLGYEIKLKGNLDIEGDISNTNPMFFFEKEWVVSAFYTDKWTTSRYEVKKSSEKADDKTVSLKGTAKLGFEISPNIFFFSEKLLRFEPSLYPNSEYILLAKCENGNGVFSITSQPSIEISGKVKIEAINAEVNLVANDFKISGEKTEIYNFKKDDYVPCSYTKTADVSNDLSVGFFKNFLKNNKFRIYEGSSPPDVIGDFICEKNILEKELVTGDANEKFNERPYGRSINRIDTKLGILDLAQYGNDGTEIISHENSTQVLEITGDKNTGEFTLFARTSGAYFSSNNNQFNNIIAITGKVKPQGIDGLKYAFYRVKNVQAFKEDIPIGGIRIFKDADGLAAVQ